MSNRKGGLGRNLDSLIPHPISPSTQKIEVTGKLEVSVDSIQPNPRQPRSIFDDEALHELAASIKEIGILQPPVVRKIGEDSYELIMGERRLRASKLAGLKSIPVIIRETSDNELLREALIENIHRSNLNSLEEAAAYSQMLNDFGFTHDELSLKVGRSRSFITNILRLLQLPPALQKMLASGVLTAGHARALLGLSDPAKMEKLAKRIVSEGLSVRSVEEIISLKNGERKEKSPPRKSLPSGKFAELEERIENALDTRVRIQSSKTGGKILIEYADGADLQRIVQAIE
jgi:ParB family chromosome partitioning protein